MRSTEALFPLVRQVLSEFIWNKKLVFLTVLSTGIIMRYCAVIPYQHTNYFFILTQLVLALPTRLVAVYFYFGRYHSCKQIFNLLILTLFIGIIPDLIQIIYNHLTAEQQLNAIKNVFRPISKYLFDSFVRGLFTVLFLIISGIMSAIFIPSFWRVVSFLLLTEDIALFSGFKNSLKIILSKFWLMFKFYLFLFCCIALMVLILSDSVLELSSLYLLGNFFTVFAKPTEQDTLIIFSILSAITSTFLNLCLLFIVNNVREKENI